MSEDSVAYYYCPILSCVIRKVKLTLDQVLEHVLYHAAFELFQAEIEIEESDRQNIQPELIKKFINNKMDDIQLSDLTNEQIQIGLCILQEKHRSSRTELDHLIRKFQPIWKRMLKCNEEKVFVRCEICSKVFIGNRRNINSILSKHRMLKHYEKILEHTFYKRRTEPDATFATYCGPCGAKVGGDPEAFAEQKIIVHQKLQHPETVSDRPFVIPVFYD